MTSLKVIVSFVFFALAIARPQQYDGHQSEEGSDESHDSSDTYDFGWLVRDDYSGGHFGHEESRAGDLVQGSYFVRLPDGRRQVVSYRVDGEHGFMAEVTYEDDN